VKHILCLWTAAMLPCLADRVFYFPKPAQPPPYSPPMKPLTRLADLKAKHRGQANWSELVIAGRNTKAWVISATPGAAQMVGGAGRPHPL
jgi:hypothetical protein